MIDTATPLIGKSDGCMKIRYATEVASTAAELEACWRLRYDVYVSEMRRRQLHADHSTRLIHDALDDRGVTFACRDSNNQIVGTIRCNHVRECHQELAAYLRLYEIDDMPDLENTAITTRLMVAPAHRNLRVVTSLVCAVYRHSLRAGISNDFMDCNAPLPALAKTFGYTVHRDSVRHAEYGDVCVMRLQLTNREHLESIKSPFLRGRDN